MSPILIALDGQRIRLSSLSNGVHFDIRAQGVLDLVAWPTDTDEGLLALDRDGNGAIDDGSELFGNHTPLADGSLASNGYEALKEFDDNDDGRIDARDRVFSKLRLWVDRNRDGKSQPDELHVLDTVGIAGLSLEYRESRRVDQWGNEFRYHAQVIPTDSGRARDSWDVFLRDAPLPR